MALVHRYARGLIVAAALVAAAVAAWVSVQRMPRSLTWPALFITALQLCLAAASVAALTAFGVYEAIRRSTRLKIGLPVEHSVQRAALSGLWAPPLLILLHRNSPWALVPAILLAAVLHRLWRRTSPVSFPGDSRMPHSVAIAALAQLSAAATVAGEMVWACAACACAALLLWGRIWRPTRKPRILRHSLTPSRRVLAMSLTAALLTVAGLTQFLRPGFGFGEGSLMATLFGGGSSDTGKRAGPPRDPRKYTSDDLSLSHRAIILYPEQKPGVIGLIPPLPQMRAELGGARRDENLRIPFFGVYWVLRRPDRQPPPGAITMRGNPAFQSFRSNDSVPLTMEARQNLGVMVNVHSCEAIEVAILNADKYKHTVRIELFLRNTALPGKPSVSLGVLPVLSEARFRFPLPGIVVEETISFPVPKTIALDEFDELQVRFETANLRADRSPRISIESFRLVPRRPA